MFLEKTQRYFIRQLDANSYRPSPEAEYEVQILNEADQAEVCAYISRDSNVVIALEHAEKGQLPVERHGIPEAVIAAARQRHIGSGEYVDETGKIVTPCFLPPFG